jgi:pyruvate dehydrogenase E1 component
VSQKSFDVDVLNSIAKRGLYFATQMIHLANHRSDKQKGDPKVGGHQSASSSCLHILGALHLVVKSGFDHMAVKPHASPTDHSFNYMLNLFLEDDLKRMDPENAATAMRGLRAFSQNGEPVFQSYHSRYDSDHHNFLPSGTVGIPPVNLGYLALAYRYAKEHGYKVPESAHFWALIGDSEFREGSLYEAIPDFAEREIGNVTWIVDYNRQSLDGNRITNKQIMGHTDDVRLQKTAEANGWEVIMLKHGSLRQKLFKKTGGDLLKKFLDEEVEDFELQALLLVKDKKALRKDILEKHPQLKKFVDAVSDDELHDCLRDLAGHDFAQIIEALEASKKTKKKPTLIIAHTVKGWGLSEAAMPGNHSSLVSQEEVDALMKREGSTPQNLFTRFDEKSKEGQYLKKRGDELYKEIQKQHELQAQNKKLFQEELGKHGQIPNSLDINLKMVSYPHTQWMLGQLTAKLTRVANTSAKDGGDSKPLTDFEKSFKVPSELFVSMAPDVGTSTNLNPAMDGKVFGATEIEDYEKEFQVKDTTLPDLVPGQDASDRFIRFEIAECNVMSCVGSFGQIRDLLGIPLLPLMNVYDFFVKRALDQYFYNLYWRSNFILGGTPAGVTLSPEGAQHGWKSDIQIPNQIVWEPFFCQELDWIFCETLKRHFYYDSEERNGVHIRCVTRGADQKEFLKRLKTQRRFKIDPSQVLSPQGVTYDGAIEESQVESLSEKEIYDQVRLDVLNGAYYLMNYEGYAGYEPGDNVVNIFSMGSPTTEAIAASDKLLEKGIYANVIVVTSPDLFVGPVAEKSDFHHLRENLKINSQLHLQPHPTIESQGELVTLAGRRVPMVSVHDGEPGLLDNIGSVVGVRHECLAVKKHSKCGRPVDVYKYHHIDADSVVEACGKVLSETALEQVQVSKSLLQSLGNMNATTQSWKELWPEITSTTKH